MIYFGIRHFVTNPRASIENGLAERLIRTIFNGVRTVLLDSQLPQSLWGEATQYLVRILLSRDETQRPHH